MKWKEGRKKRKDREKRERGRDKEGREEGRYEKGGREKFSFTYGRLLWAWTLGGSPAEVDNVIDLHGNCSRTRTVDGIKLKHGVHKEEEIKNKLRTSAAWISANPNF